MNKILLPVWGMLVLALLLSACQKNTSTGGNQPSQPTGGLTTKAGEYTVNVGITPWPAKVGDAYFNVQVADRAGKPVDDAKVTLSLSMPSMSMGGPTVETAPKGQGTYMGKATLSMASDWAAEVSVKPPNKKSAKGTVQFEVK